MSWKTRIQLNGSGVHTKESVIAEWISDNKGSLGGDIPVFECLELPDTNDGVPAWQVSQYYPAGTAYPRRFVIRAI